MSRPIFTEDATEDAAQAIRWHEAERRGRGAKFLAVIETALDHIEHRPESFPELALRFRRIIVRCFPYALFYRVEADQIVIHAVFHTSRNPSKLSDRLRDA